MNMTGEWRMEREDKWVVKRYFSHLVRHLTLPINLSGELEDANDKLAATASKWRGRRFKKLDKSLDYEEFQTLVSKVMISTAGMERCCLHVCVWKTHVWSKMIIYEFDKGSMYIQTALSFMAWDWVHSLLQIRWMIERKWITGGACERQNIYHSLKSS